MDSMFSKIKKPSLADKMAEHKENKGLVNPESNFDYNPIKQAEGNSPINPENRYNEENYQEPNFKEVVDESTGEDAIIEQIDDKLEAERKQLEKEGDDPYGFKDIISDLVTHIINKKSGDEELRQLFKRVDSFWTEYQSILKKSFSPEEENQICHGVFQRTIGDVAYVKDGNKSSVELLERYHKIREAKPGARGYKIFYDRFGNGYLTKKEAEKADRTPAKEVNRTTSRRIKV